MTVPRPSQRTHMPPVREKVTFSVRVLSAPRSTVKPPLADTEATLKENAPGGPK